MKNPLKPLPRAVACGCGKSHNLPPYALVFGIKGLPVAFEAYAPYAIVCEILATVIESCGC